VNNNRPCKICGKGDWCCFTDDGAVRCMRVTDAAGWKAIKKHTDGGVTFRPEGEEPYRPNQYARPKPKPKPTRDDWDELHGRFLEELTPTHMAMLSCQLGVTSKALRAMGLGYSESRRAYTFPMYNARGDITGMRLRNRQGKKYAITLSRDGIFASKCCDWGSRTLIAEGPTDCAALFDLGHINVIGRPSCRGAVLITKEVVGDLEAVIVSDRDGPGLEGSRMLAEHLIGSAKSVKIIMPPGGFKDVREWVGQGASFEAIETLILEAEVCTDGEQIQRITRI
jgi:hypothetical protein